MRSLRHGQRADRPSVGIRDDTHEAALCGIKEG